MGKLDKRPDQRNLKAVKRTLDVLDEEVQALNRKLPSRRVNLRA